MLESLVWSIVERYADIYIKGFKPDSLKVSLWEGEITLTNVELNTDVRETEGVRDDPPTLTPTSLVVPRFRH